MRRVIFLQYVKKQNLTNPNVLGCEFQQPSIVTLKCFARSYDQI